MKKIKYILFGILLVSITSCELMGNIDDIQPENVLTDETLVSDKNSAEAAVNGVYSSWRSIDIGWFTSLMSMRSHAENFRYIGGYQGFAENDIKVENIGVEKNYTALYRVINIANSVLAQLEGEFVEGLEAARQTEMIAELKFHRAMAHFHLLRQFGEFWDATSEYGVVTYTEPVRSNTPKQRESVGAVYELIVNDLNAVISDAPVFPKGHYYVSQTTGKALLARVKLYQGAYPQAAQLAGEVIAEAPGAGYMLEEVYFDVFRNAAKSSEVLFSLYASYPNEPTSMNITNLKVGDTSKRIADEMVEGDMVYDARYTDAYINAASKYVQNDYASGEMANTHFFIRLAEMYYILAEAEARQSHFDEARLALAAICERAGYAQEEIEAIPNALVLEQILKHKWMELNTENNEEWYDLVRYHVIDDYVIAPDYVASDKLLTLPIPRSAMAGNNLLKQNKGYE
ncbi:MULTISPECIES: RagB/SusD family nutrient uptake outer membrane protein [unclassified Carboxylicivirga]|uniref:RagB/SusD family nutrient uptake outer membrane protein n=1 Tax=Carboxylicivirga TaxID=1628153 RepID=UPI003D350363